MLGRAKLYKLKILKPYVIFSLEYYTIEWYKQYGELKGNEESLQLPEVGGPHIFIVYVYNGFAETLECCK